MIPDKITDPNRGVRTVHTVFGLIVILLGILTCIFAADSALDRSIFMIGMTLAGLLTISLGHIRFPHVILDYEGVTVRFLRKRAFLWNQISQAGRYHHDRRSYSVDCYALVLLFPGGTLKRTGIDKTFLDRNLLKAVALPNERNIRLFITARYGNLDFDDYDLISEAKRKAFQLDQT